MNGEAKKLHLIEEILKIENESVLSEVENVINKSKMHVVNRKSFKEFAGFMTDQEADKINNAIEEGCEKVFSDDWK